ncbi:cadmium-translocating P-type ATPase [Lachnospiraceae bacterium ASD4241]|uniref:Cd(2+)-exporting ATPase n=2 Tax=Diplocloster modestus TaxID=2850322 RepID=A0ABS6KC63_9FIRM|nr:heavy metal translocating P-type ATPase [Diplocloster modestus]MBU9728097.1 cadmium-translocating P-type ATPase [Diplocloster modestus]
MTKKQKKTLTRIIVSAILLGVFMLMPTPAVIPEEWQMWWQLGIMLIPYLLIGGDVVWKAVRNILHGEVFDENFLMSIATVGAMVIGEYSEGVAVMLFYQVGELFQSYAVNRSRQSITQLMDIRPDYANIEEDGGLRQVDPEEVRIGDIIVVKAGERVPLDGKVASGTSLLDTSALTGESVPREVVPGSDVISGCINTSGLLRIEVTREFQESTVAKILDLVENASSKKAKAENFITKFARYYTPVVVIAALLLAVIPPLFLGLAWGDWVNRALIFLVISCPCALVISIPLSFFGGIGGASKCGILVKGSNYLEALADMTTIVFDKTGTLTKGVFKVTKLHPAGMKEEELLQYAALAESYSDHPISLSLKEAYGRKMDAERIGEVEEIPGHGVSAVVDGHRVLAGNLKLMKRMDIPYEECSAPGTVVYVAVDDKFAGSIVIADEVKEDAKTAIAALNAAGVRKTVMLTGDRREVGEEVASKLGLDQVYTELLPGDKVDKVEELLQNMNGREQLAFVGDGINDAPVLSRADIGIAMGAMGSDAAIEAADIVLMDDEPSKIAVAVRIARKTLRIVRQNIVFALAVKAFFLILGAFGVANMWEAVFADVGVSVIAILNATRALRAEQKKETDLKTVGSAQPEV